MIVRFPKVDARMEQIFRELVFRYSHSFDPIFSEIETYNIHEGQKTSMKHGSETWSDDLYESSAEYEIKAEDHESFGADEFQQFAQSIGKQFLDSKKRNLFDTLNRVTAKTGNVLDRKNSPLDHEAIFKVFEMMEIDFDDEGRPRMPSIIIPPDMAPRMAELAKEEEQNPEIR